MNISNHSAADQRTRLLSYLKKNGSATTIEIGHALDILAPAPRVYELRHNQNINIETVWDEAKNPQGSAHRVARYILKAGPYKKSES